MSLHAKSIRDGRSAHTRWLTAGGRRGRTYSQSVPCIRGCLAVQVLGEVTLARIGVGGGGCPLAAREMDGLTRWPGIWSLEKGLPKVGQDPPTF